MFEDLNLRVDRVELLIRHAVRKSRTAWDCSRLMRVAAQLSARMASHWVRKRSRAASTALTASQPGLGIDGLKGRAHRLPTIGVPDPGERRRIDRADHRRPIAMNDHDSGGRQDERGTHPRSDSERRQPRAAGEGLEKVGHGWPALIGLRLQAAIEDPLQPARRAAAGPRTRFRPLAGHRFVEGHAEAVDVGAGIRAAGEPLLGRHVGRRAGAKTGGR